MGFDIDRARRLESMRIDEQTRAVLRDLKTIITPHLDDAIETAYKHLMSYPDAARAYQGLTLQDMVASQRRHWLEDLMPATFSDAQIQGAVDLFQRRQKSGLNLRWYFVFYSAMLRHLMAKIAPSYRKRPEQLIAVTDAMSSVLLFDLELASAAYM